MIMEMKLEADSNKEGKPLVIKNQIFPLEDINTSPEKKENLMDSVSTGTKAIVTLRISVASCMKNLHIVTFKKVVEELRLADFSILVRLF